MQIFFGYFVWGLILGVPVSWLVWRFQLHRFLPRFMLRHLKADRQRSARLPPQLGALVIRGVRQFGKADSK
jgi:hypothetical protein